VLVKYQCFSRGIWQRRGVSDPFEEHEKMMPHDVCELQLFHKVVCGPRRHEKGCDDGVESRGD
jgi:hypothetical protein